MFQFCFHKKSSEFNLQIAASNQTSQSLNAEPYFSAYCRLPTAYWLLVRKGGLEPPHLSVPDPKSGASANSATFANLSDSREDSIRAGVIALRQQAPAAHPFCDQVNRITDRQQAQRPQTIFRVPCNCAGEKSDRSNRDDQSRPGIAPYAIRPRQIRLAFAQHEHRNESHRVIGHEKEGDDGEHLIEGSAQDENDGDHRADQQRYCRRSSDVYSRAVMTEQAIAAHRIQNPWRAQGVGIDGA